MKHGSKSCVHSSPTLVSDGYLSGTQAANYYFLQAQENKDRSLLLQGELPLNTNDGNSNFISTVLKH